MPSRCQNGTRKNKAGVCQPYVCRSASKKLSKTTGKCRYKRCKNGYRRTTTNHRCQKK